MLSQSEGQTVTAFMGHVRKGRIRRIRDTCFGENAEVWQLSDDRVNLSLHVGVEVVKYRQVLHWCTRCQGYRRWEDARPFGILGATCS